MMNYHMSPYAVHGFQYLLKKESISSVNRFIILNAYHWAIISFPFIYFATQLY